MSLSPALHTFQRTIGHQFNEPAHLKHALTHASAVQHAHQNNQRLEFLGDRVLGVTIAHALFTGDPHAKEGALALRLNALVRKETLFEIAQSLNLRAVLFLGPVEAKTDPTLQPAILADALEAVLAAIYLDSDFATVQRVILRLWDPWLKNSHTEHPKDAKSKLQEWAHTQGYAEPTYHLIKTQGPGHALWFCSEVRITPTLTATGCGASRRKSEQAAADTFLHHHNCL